MTARLLSQRLEATAAWLLYAMLGLMPVDMASAFGSWLARSIGPRLRVSDTARRNLKKEFPEKSTAEIEKIITGMWDNLGRTAGEHPHISQFDPYRENSRVEVIGGEYVDQLRDDEQAGILFSGHIANWEMAPLTCTKRGLALHVVYRAANNPFFDRIIQKGRAALNGELIPKGPKGARVIVHSLRKGEHLAMLVDQKMNDGIAVPFLGRDAMTAPAVAELAYRYDCPVVPAQVERLKGARFRVTFHPPLNKPDSGDKQQDVAQLMKMVNDHLSDWVRARPEQWLWVHNRWPD